MKYDLTRYQTWFRTWATSTEIARVKFKRDYDIAEGNGKQWRNVDKAKVESTSRPALEYNLVLPQVEYLCGVQRSMNVAVLSTPRGQEDRRLSEVANATIRSVFDFERIQRTVNKVFDDATICGLGVCHVSHSIENSDDILWGDITAERINPSSFIYDPWATRQDLQDGQFMGHASWMTIEEARERWPQHHAILTPGEWLSSSAGAGAGDSQYFGLGPNLISEVWDGQTGRVRVLTLWYKVPVDVTFLADNETGRVEEFDSKAKAGEELERRRHTISQDHASRFSLIQQGTAWQVIDTATGQPFPQQFVDQQMAQGFIDQESSKKGMEVFDRLKVISRKTMRPRWVEMVYWQVLDEDESPYADNNYPYCPYISRQLSDDPESIMGIVRNLWDPTFMYNKWASGLLAQLNSSSHSGWLNKKSAGANSRELANVGSRAGAVVEYASVPPVQIQPVPLSAGHFQMMQMNERNIFRISSINGESVGAPGGQSVSGRAISARQSGSSITVQSRLTHYEDFLLDLNKLIFRRIQQYYPIEKIRRILGTMDSIMPLGPNGDSIFLNPETGAPLSESIILSALRHIKKIDFDLVLRTAPLSLSERQTQFERAMMMSTLISQTGRQLGPSSLKALVEMSEIPHHLAEGLARDATAPPVNPQIPQDVTGSLKNMTDEMRGGRSGGSQATPAGGAPPVDSGEM